MFFSIVPSLLLLSVRLESGGGGGGGTAFPDSITCLWTTAVPSLQRQMLSVLPLWFRLQSKQETQRFTNRAPAWTSQTCTTTVPLKCTTALSPGKWKVNLFVDANRATIACIHLTRCYIRPCICSQLDIFKTHNWNPNAKLHMSALFGMHEWNCCQNKFWRGWHTVKNYANSVLVVTIREEKSAYKAARVGAKVSYSKNPKRWTKSQL